MCLSIVFMSLDILFPIFSFNVKRRNKIGFGACQSAYAKGRWNRRSPRPCGFQQLIYLPSAGHPRFALHCLLSGLRSTEPPPSGPLSVLWWWGWGGPGTADFESFGLETTRIAFASISLAWRSHRGKPGWGCLAPLRREEARQCEQ